MLAARGEVLSLPFLVRYFGSREGSAFAAAW